MKPHPLAELANDHLLEGPEGLSLSDAGLERLAQELAALKETPALGAALEGLYSFADFLLAQEPPYPAGFTLLGLVASVAKHAALGAKDAQLIAARAEERLEAVTGKERSSRVPVGGTPPPEGAQKNDPALRFRLGQDFDKKR
jgi:hypothetical protein